MVLRGLKRTRQVVYFIVWLAYLPKSIILLDFDRDCIDNLRMERNCLGRLFILFREGVGLVDEAFDFIVV